MLGLFGTYAELISSVMRARASSLSLDIMIYALRVVLKNCYINMSFLSPLLETFSRCLSAVNSERRPGALCPNTLSQY